MERLKDCGNIDVENTPQSKIEIIRGIAGKLESRGNKQGWNVQNIIYKIYKHMYQSSNFMDNIALKLNTKIQKYNN